MFSATGGSKLDTDGYGYRGWPYLLAFAVMVATIINLIQFPGIERSLPPTWQALTRAADDDLAAVAAERDESGAVGLQFSLVLALREHAPGRALVLSDNLPLQGVLAPELLTGLGQVTCIEQRLLDQEALADAIPTGHPVAATALITTAKDPLVLLLDEPVGPTILLLDARDQRGQVVLIDTALLPAAVRPEAGC